MAVHTRPGSARLGGIAPFPRDAMLPGRCWGMSRALSGQGWCWVPPCGEKQRAGAHPARGTGDMWGDVVAAGMRAVGAASAQGLGLVSSLSQAPYRDAPPCLPWDISWQTWQLSHLCWRSLCLLAGGTQGWGGFNPAVRSPAPRGFGASPQKLLQRERGHAGWTGAGISSSPIPRRLSGQGGSGQAPPCGPAPRAAAVCYSQAHSSHAAAPHCPVPSEQRDSGFHATGKHPPARSRH